jgi:hypothetical protein
MRTFRAKRVFRPSPSRRVPNRKRGSPGAKSSALPNAGRPFPVRQATWSRPLEIEVCERRIARAQSGRCVYSSEFPIGPLRRSVSGPTVSRGLASAATTTYRAPLLSSRMRSPLPSVAMPMVSSAGSGRRCSVGCAHVRQQSMWRQNSTPPHALRERIPGVSARPREWRWAERSPVRWA